jgi:UDP-glucose 4-epimerase
VSDVIKAVKKVTGVDFAVRLGARLAGNPARLVAAIERIKAAFGWQPRGTGLKLITRSALAWEKRLLETTL